MNKYFLKLTTLLLAPCLLGEPLFAMGQTGLNRPWTPAASRISTLDVWETQALATRALYSDQHALPVPTGALHIARRSQHGSAEEAAAAFEGKPFLAAQAFLLIERLERERAGHVFTSIQFDQDGFPEIGSPVDSLGPLSSVHVELHDGVWRVSSTHEGAIPDILRFAMAIVNRRIERLEATGQGSTQHTVLHRNPQIYHDLADQYMEEITHLMTELRRMKTPEAQAALKAIQAENERLGLQKARPTSAIGMRAWSARSDQLLRFAERARLIAYFGGVPALYAEANRQLDAFERQSDPVRAAIMPSPFQTSVSILNRQYAYADERLDHVDEHGVDTPESFSKLLEALVAIAQGQRYLSHLNLPQDSPAATRDQEPPSRIYRVRFPPTDDILQELFRSKGVYGPPPGFVLNELGPILAAVLEEHDPLLRTAQKRIRGLHRISAYEERRDFMPTISYEQEGDRLFLRVTLDPTGTRLRASTRQIVRTLVMVDRPLKDPHYDELEALVDRLVRKIDGEPDGETASERTRNPRFTGEADRYPGRILDLQGPDAVLQFDSVVNDVFDHLRHHRVLRGDRAQMLTVATQLMEYTIGFKNGQDPIITFDQAYREGLLDENLMFVIRMMPDGEGPEQIVVSPEEDFVERYEFAFREQDFHLAMETARRSGNSLLNLRPHEDVQTAPLTWLGPIRHGNVRKIAPVPARPAMIRDALQQVVREMAARPKHSRIGRWHFIYKTFPNGIVMEIRKGEHGFMEVSRDGFRKRLHLIIPKGMVPAGKEDTRKWEELLYVLFSEVTHAQFPGDPDEEVERYALYHYILRRGVDAVLDIHLPYVDPGKACSLFSQRVVGVLTLMMTEHPELASKTEGKIAEMIYEPSQIEGFGEGKPYVDLIFERLAEEMEKAGEGPSQIFERGTWVSRQRHPRLVQTAI